jgi:hypothetical protein
VVKHGKGRNAKDHDVPMIFVVYAENHSVDCYHMWNLATKKQTETGDVICLHHMYYQNNTQKLDYYWQSRSVMTIS